MLDKYRINPKQEWFKFPNEDIPIQTINIIVDIMDSHIETLDSFIPNLHTFLKPTSIQPNIQQPYIQQPYIKTNTETPIMETTPMETTSRLPIERHITETTTTSTNETSTKTPTITPITETHIRYKIDDFEQFIKDFCELGDDKYCYKPDIKQAHRIWCKSIVDKDITKKLETYLSNKFKSSQVWENDTKRYVYKGVSLKPFEYHPKNNWDYELFLKEKCKFYYSYRTSYTDFFNQFVKWKQQTEPEYKLQHKYKKLIQAYLEETFAGGRVHLPLNSNNTKTTKTHLFGVYGVGFEFNNYGTKEPIRTNKKVGQFNIKTNQLVTSWNSLIVAARELNMQFSTLSYNIRFGTIKNECIFRYMDN
jgi:hypothetical protein